MGQDSGVTEGTGNGADQDDTQVVDLASSAPPAAPVGSPRQPPAPPPPGAPGTPVPADTDAWADEPEPTAPPEPPVFEPMRPGTGTITELKTGPTLGVRALWFIFVGWWLTGIVSAVAWVAMVTLIGLPLGIWLINRIPTVLTLRPRTSYRYQYTDQLGRLVSFDAPIDQPPWWIRGLWFVFVGWWASAIAMAIGWALVVLIITLPIGLWIYNRVPAVASLYRY
jgi:uncharacterized membrane protein YccF (DUF307 family)